MLKMGTQQSELGLGMRVKQILESVTGARYVFKTRSELIHPNGISWFVHLPREKPEGWIRHAEQEGDMVTFQSHLVFDVGNVMEFEHRRSYMNKEIWEDIPALHKAEIRHKYAKRIPKVTKFFDELDKVISDIDGRYPRSFSYVNDQGMVSIVLKTTTSEVSKNEPAIITKLGAMRELLHQVEKISR